ncbi:hypothetical protein ACNOYE_04100 [Nannocystaceae bacterium ST9]
MQPTPSLRMLGVGLLALLGACKSELGGEGAACKVKDDCAEGLNCLDGTCTKLATDAVAEATPWCRTLSDLAGEWAFDTTVVGAEDLGARGINGHYQLSVTLTGCEAQAKLTKTGHDKTNYSESKIQRSEAPLIESKRIPGAAEATVALKGKPTHTFTFVVRDGQLFGFWQSIGDEWTRAGMWGFLRGAGVGEALANVEDFMAQPCEVACLTECDVPRREADASLDAASLGACMTGCAAGERIPCPAAPELPESLILALEGPVASKAEACSTIAAALGSGPVECNDQPLVGDKPTARVLEGKALGGAFERAELVQVGFVGVGGYKGSLHLLLQTKAGWYGSAAIADLSVAALGGATLAITDLDLLARDLLPGLAGREIVVGAGVEAASSNVALNEVETDDTDRSVVCSGGEAPTCVMLTRHWSARRTLIKRKGDDPAKHPDLFDEEGELSLSFLPEGRISISTPAEARAEDRQLAGIYAWPAKP